MRNITAQELQEAHRRVIERDHIRGDGTIAVIESGDSLTVYIIILETP